MAVSITCVDGTNLPVFAPTVAADDTFDHRAVGRAIWDKHAAFCAAVTVVGVRPVVGEALRNCGVPSANRLVAGHHGVGASL